MKMKKIINLIRLLFPESFMAFAFWYIFCLPNPLFADPYSTVLFDKNGLILKPGLAFSTISFFNCMKSRDII